MKKTKETDWLLQCHVCKENVVVCDWNVPAVCLCKKCQYLLDNWVKYLGAVHDKIKKTEQMSEGDEE